MIRLEATTLSEPVGAVLSASRRASVHSAYGKALNLRCEGGELVAILSDAAPMAPNGVHVALGAARLDGICAGTPVTSSDGALTIGEQLRIDWAKARAWSPRLRPTHLAGAAALAEAAARARASSGSNAELVRRGDALIDALEAGDEARTQEAALGLVGFGRGLTPAGDDLLLGCHAALATAAHPDAQRLAELMTTHQRRTTTVSAALFRCAARGHHAEATIWLASALLSGERAAYDAAIERASSVGATSGRDTVLGAALGVTRIGQWMERDRLDRLDPPELAP